MTDEWNRFKREHQKLEELRKEENDLYTSFCGARHRRSVQEDEVNYLWDRLMERARADT